MSQGGRGARALLERGVTEVDLLRSVLDAEPVAVALYESASEEHDLRVVYANPMTQALRRSTPMQGRLFSEVWSDIAPHALGPMLAVLKTGRSWNVPDMELRVEDEEGISSIRNFAHQSRRVSVDGHDYVLVVLSESTATVERERNRLQTVLDTLPVAVFVTDENGAILYANRTAFDLWAGAPLVESAAHYGEYKAWWPETGERLRAEEWGAARALSGTQVIGEMVDIERFDGTRATILNSAVPIRDSDGRITGAVAVAEDITERRRIEDTLASERAQLHAVLDSMVEGVALWAPDGSMLDMNDAMANIHGYPSKRAMLDAMARNADIAIRTLDGKVPPEPDLPGQRTLRGEVFRGEDLLIDVAETGKHLVLSFGGAPVRDPRSGRVILGVMTAHDVTALHEARGQAERELETTRLLLEAADALNTWTDMRELLRGLSDITLRSTRHSRVVILLTGQDPTLVQIVASSGSGLIEEGSSLDFGETSTGVEEELLQGRSVVIDYDALEMPAPMFAGYDAHRGLVVPMRYSDQLLGYISIDDPGDRPEFSAREIRLAEGIAAQAAVAIENAQLFEHQVKTRDFAEALNRVAELVHSSFTTDAIMQRIVFEAAETLGVTTAAVEVKGPQGWGVKYAYGLPPDAMGAPLTDKPIIAERVEETRSPLVINDTTGEDPISLALRAVGILSLLAIPLVTRDEMFGVLMLFDSNRSHVFINGERDFARKLASTVSLALANAELFGRERQAAEYARRLTEIDQMLHSTLDVDQMCERAVVAVQQAADASAVSIAFLEGDDLVPRYVAGPAGDRLRGLTLPVGEARFAAAALQSEGPLWSEDGVRDERVSGAVLARLGASALIRQRLMFQGEARGMLSVDYAEPQSFSAELIEFVRRVGVTLSMALENAQRFESERTVADRLQEALLALPDNLSGIDFAHAYHSAAEAARVGGDFYDLFEIEHDMIGITMGDVAGKGLDAAVLTSLVKNTIRAHAQEKGATPARILSLTNDVIYAATTPESFVTVFFAVLRCEDGVLVYANGGHTTPGVVNPDGRVDPFEVTGPLLGALPAADFEEREHHLTSDQLLFLYTDGLTEARRDDGDMFGEDRVFELLSSLRNCDPEQTVQGMIDEILAFTDGRLADDVALLAVKRQQRAGTPTQQRLEL